MGFRHAVRTANGNGCGMRNVLPGNKVMLHLVFTDRRGKSVLGVDYINRADSRAAVLDCTDGIRNAAHRIFS